MKCEKCGVNTATTHIKSIVNGVSREIYLCPVCAAKEGYGDISNLNFAGMLASMFGEHSQISGNVNDKKCPVCNSSFSNIAKSGKVGCAECYKTFKSELLPYLKRVHGSTVHTGKIPNSAPLIVKPDTPSVEDLRIELNRLVAEEKYEQAAVIRDEIKRIEGEINE